MRSLLPYRSLKSLNTVGYSELFAHFDGAYDLRTAEVKISQHTRNYAKRQLTWFRNQGNYRWLTADGILKTIIHL